MAPKKCCVLHCESNSDTHRLFHFPRNDDQRKLWLDFLVPRNPYLKSLTKQQLISKGVCQLHFDRRQFDGQGNRITGGYPSLFTNKEISHRIPIESGSNIIEHNYFKSQCEDSSRESALKEVPNENIASTSYITSQISEKITINPVTPVFQSGSNPMIEHDYFKSQCEDSSRESALKGSSDKAITSNISTTATIECFPLATTTVNTETGCDHIKNLRTKRKCLLRTKIDSKYYSNKQLSSETVNKISDLTSKVIKDIRREATKSIEFNERFSKAKALSQKLSFGKITKQAETFIDMQLRHVCKKKKGVRFSMDEKLLSLSLLKESPKGYKLLQKMFLLPSKRTLNRVSENIKFNTGINKPLFELLKKKVANWDEKKKLCSIVFDEVALTPGISYLESIDEIRGFVDIGKESKVRFCDHALVVMIRGICTSWRQPVAYYFIEGTMPAAKLQNLLKEITDEVMQAGLTPLAFISDQGATFRRAYKDMRQESKRNRILNGQEDDDETIDINGQKISLVYDPPHLLKSIRNNFVSKDMIFKNKVASWKDIVQVYELDCQLGHSRMLPKINDSHVYADKIKKMKVSVATQIMSERTSAMLKYTASFKSLLNGSDVSNSMATTGDVVEFFDRLFDSVNGSRGGSTRGKLRTAVKEDSPHKAFWVEALKIIKDMRFVDACSKKAIKNKTSYTVRPPCLEGWITTLKSFMRISDILFKKYNLKYYYPRLINQDPLENFFGRIRAINYRNTNPDCNSFVNAYKSLLMTNIMGPHSIYANCEDDSGEIPLDFIDLFQKNAAETNKENIFIDTSTSHSDVRSFYEDEININNAVKEKVRVHSSAYVAGFVSRKLNKCLNCSDCKKTYLSDEPNQLHEYIKRREYSLLKNRCLSYPNETFIRAYRECAEKINVILENLNTSKNINKKIDPIIFNLELLAELGCQRHKIQLKKLFCTTIKKIQIHSWCKTINKILKGCYNNVANDHIKKMAFNKYLLHTKRKKKLNK